jgi:hypothetical protein
MVAILELVRLRGVFAEQSVPFAEIYLRPGDRKLGEEDLMKIGEQEVG